MKNDVVEVQSPHGSVRAPVFLYLAIRPDVVSMPFGQGHDAYGQYARGRGANPAAILSPTLADAQSGQLAWAATRVRIRPTGQSGRIVTYTRNLSGSRQLPDYDLAKTIPLRGGGA